MAIKRFIALFLCAALCFLLTACGSVYVSVLEPELSPNTIGPKPLTERERELLALISAGDQEIYLFSYKVDQEYRRMDVWVELYKDGVLFEANAGGMSMVFLETVAREGTLAVTVSHTPDYRWKFSLTQGASMGSYTSDPNTNYLSGGRGFSQMSQSTEVKADKEIILYQSVFSDGPIAVFDEQTFVEHPEKLEQYPYAHIIKCKFSKSEEEA